MADISFRDVCERIEASLDLRLHTFEYELALLLYEFGDATPSDLARRINASDATLFAALNRLKQSGTINGKPCPQDGRRTVYQLEMAARTVLDREFRLVIPWFAAKIDSEMADPDRLPDMFRAIAAGLNVHCLTPEFEIILLLYDRQSLPNHDLAALCRSSRSHFQNSLGRLLRTGHITRSKDPTDGRKSVYALDGNVRQLLSVHYRIMNRWFQGWLETG